MLTKLPSVARLRAASLFDTRRHLCYSSRMTNPAEGNQSITLRSARLVPRTGDMEEVCTYVLAQYPAATVTDALDRDIVTLGLDGMRRAGFSGRQNAILSTIDALSTHAAITGSDNRQSLAEASAAVGRYQHAANSSTIPADEVAAYNSLRKRRHELGKGATWRRVVASVAIGAAMFAGLDAYLFNRMDHVPAGSSASDLYNREANTAKAGIIAIEAVLDGVAVGLVAAATSDRAIGRRARRQARRMTAGTQSRP
jgi:hypothetical protein